MEKSLGGTNTLARKKMVLDPEVIVSQPHAAFYVDKKKKVSDVATTVSVFIWLESVTEGTSNEKKKMITNPFKKGYVAV